MRQRPLGTYETTAQRAARRADRMAHDPEYAARERERARERARRSYARERAAMPPAVQSALRPSTAAYHRAYRARNRERVNAQQQARRAVRRTDAAYRERLRAYARHHGWWKGPPLGEPTPLPRLFTGDPLLERAWLLATQRWLNGRYHYYVGDYVYRAEPEDAAGEAVLAMLEGRDPRAAAERVFAQAGLRMRHEMPYAEEP